MMKGGRRSQVGGWSQRQEAGGWAVEGRSQHTKSKMEKVDPDGECRDSRDREVKIESELAEWQTGLAEQQAYAGIDPRSSKDDEDDHDDDDNCTA